MLRAPLVRLAVALILFAANPGLTTAAQAQTATGSITVQGYSCPRGMTADTLVADQCVELELTNMAINWLANEDFPLTLADATWDGSAVTWDGLPLSPAGETVFTLLARPLPHNYRQSVFLGDDRIMADNLTLESGVAGLALSVDEPSSFVQIYFFRYPDETRLNVPIDVVNCTSMPAGMFLRSRDPACMPGIGIWFEAVDEDGTFYGNCVTELSPSGLSGQCRIELPWGSTVIVTEDEDTVPVGYAPRFNPLTFGVPFPDIDAPIEFAAFINLLQLEPEPTIESTEEWTEPEPTATRGTVVEPSEAPLTERPAHIHPGACGTLKRVPSIDLVALATYAGAKEGSGRAADGEMSFSTIDISIEELLNTEYSINVHKSVDKMSAYLVCGEIGGTVLPDGSLVVGLREMRHSGYEGIAYLTPNPDDPSKTDVWLFIGHKLAEEEQPTATLPPVASPEASPVAN